MSNWITNITILRKKNIIVNIYVHLKDKKILRSKKNK